MRKVLISGLCASLLFSSFAGTSAIAATKEISTSTQVTENLDKQEVKVAYDQEFIAKMLNESSGGFALVLPYKEGAIKVPEG